MYEFEVMTQNKTIIYVLAETWERHANTIYFYQHKKVVKQLSSLTIRSIQKTYPEREEPVIIEQGIV